MIIGEDVYISEKATIKQLNSLFIEDHVAVDECVITTKLYVGSYVHIAPYVSVIGGKDAILVIGNFCTISAGARVICRSDSFDGSGLVSTPNLPEEYKNRMIGNRIQMRDFSALGTNSILMPDTCLAEGVVVGANSLVTHPIEEPWTIWYGSPARKIKDRPKDKMLEYASKLGYL